jgi:predicted nucleic acid-binding protein
VIWVLDASVAIRWLLAGEEHPHADSVLHGVVDRPEFFAVPELFCYEVYAVLCRLHPSPWGAYIKGISPILHSGILRSPMTDDLAGDAVRFTKMGLTGYDACYAALAMQLKGTWLTFDAKAHQCVARAGVSHLLQESLPEGWPGATHNRRTAAGSERHRDQRCARSEKLF